MELIYFVVVVILLLAGLVSVGFALTLAMAAKRGDNLRTQCLSRPLVEKDLALVNLKKKLGDLEQGESALMDQLAHFVVVERRSGEKGMLASA